MKAQNPRLAATTLAPGFSCRALITLWWTHGAASSSVWKTDACCFPLVVTWGSVGSGHFTRLEARISRPAEDECLCTGQVCFGLMIISYALLSTFMWRSSKHFTCHSI